MISAPAPADTTPDHCVRAPACWLIAERVSDPEPGMHEKKLPARLANASERHCWFRSSFCRVTAEIAFPIAMASSNPSSAIASAPDAKVMEAGGPNMPAVKVDRIIADGDTVTLGGATLTAHLTPGHTKGCTTWTMTTKEADRAYDVLFHCSSSIVDKLVGNQGYPNIVEDYETSFAKIRALKADIFLANHPFFFRMEQKRAAMKDRAPNPFVDPSELQRFNDQQEQRFKEALEKR